VIKNYNYVIIFINISLLIICYVLHLWEEPKKRCTTCQHSDILFWRFSSQCLSPLMLWVRISIRARCITLCGNVCKWLATCRWFSQVSSTNKTDHHDITEALLKVALNTIILTLYISIDIHICICVDIDIVLSVLFQCWSIILQ
jgi:hypothetical protein